MITGNWSKKLPDAQLGERHQAVCPRGTSSAKMAKWSSTKGLERSCKEKGTGLTSRKPLALGRGGGKAMCSDRVKSESYTGAREHWGRRSSRQEVRKRDHKEQSFQFPREGRMDTAWEGVKVRRDDRLSLRMGKPGSLLLLLTCTGLTLEKSPEISSGQKNTGT